MIRRRLVATILVLAAGTAVGHAAGEDERFAALIGLARVKRDAGDAGDARRYFEQARQVHPLTIDQLAEYFWIVASVNPSDAVSAGRDVLRASPHRDDIRDRLITAAEAAHDEAAVVALATDGAAVEPANARWARRLGQSFLRQNRPAQAVGAFHTATRLTGTDVRDQAELAVALEADRQPRAAMQTWARVPAAVRDERPEWAASRLRALAQIAPAETVIPALEAWLRAHPDDQSTRLALVNLYARTGRPDLALAALTDTTRPPALDRWALASLYVDAHDYARAVTVVRDASGDDPCSARVFSVLDRLPDPLGIDAMLRAIRLPGCVASTPWLRRTLDRTVALGRHDAALTVLQALPDDVAATAEIRRLHGQLLLWTGQSSRAIDILEPLVRDNIADTTARDALVDAYRAAGRPRDAWTTARPFLDAPTLPAARVLLLADLALESGEPAHVADIVARGPAEIASSNAARERRGRAALMLGRPADAAAFLTTIPSSTLTPPGALALIDSVASTTGRAAAAQVASTFTAETPDWREVMARRVTLEAVTGHADASARLRSFLATLDPALALIADAETALAEARPHDALTALARVTAAELAERARDLEATAFENIGDERSAANRLADLTAARPDSASYAIRLAVARWRLDPTAAALAVVLDLPDRWPGNEEAMTAAARLRVERGDFAGALRTLGGESAWSRLGMDGRVLAARSLQALDRPADALNVIDQHADLDGAGLILRAQLIAAVRGPGAASSAFRDAASRPSATPDAFVAWTAIATSPTERSAILRRGVERFPSNVPMLTSLAEAEWRAGRAVPAAQLARRAIASDSGAAAAWFVLADATRASATAFGAVLDDFERQAAGRAPLLVGMAEHVGALTPAPDAATIARAVRWLDAVPARDPLASARDMARVHVFAAAGRWGDALAAVEALLAHKPTSPPVLKLHAQVLSWAGRHDEALAAYDAYLETSPDDVDARREQARVATWAGRTDDARRLYARLRARAPDSTAIAAEADAKVAFLTGRWETAIAAYRRWLAIEPANTEAQFELAEALRALGDPVGADRVLEGLIATSRHRLAPDALAQAARAREPNVAAVDDEKSADGYDGERLLDLRQRGGSLSMTFGPDGSTALRLEGAALSASGGDADRGGGRLGATITRRVSPRVSLDGDVAAWSFGGGTAVSTGRVQGAWRATDRWIYTAGLIREPLFETLETIDSRLTGSGAFTGAALSTPAESFDVQAAWEALSDGNRRQHTTLSFTHVASEHLRQLQAVVWAESLAYQHAEPLYFSPDAFLRLDAGAEYTHAFTPIRFRGDRRNELTAGYLIGTDNHGVIYHHPTVRLTVELASGLALEARGSWIRSETYRETAFSVGLRVPVPSLGAGSSAVKNP